MSCPALALDTGASLAELLRALDCRTGEATASAFGRLFGESGALLPALTILLTLYVAIFAIQLLTGRASVGVSALTPRMLTLGLALTFATSWMAYQQTVWTLATGAPDQIATVIAGTSESATDVFAKRLDVIFDTLAESAKTASQTGGGQPAPGQNGMPAVAQSSGLFTAENLLYGSGLMLLVGTLGVLVTAKIALAALLAIGPVFIILALFRGTRGLFEGWLKGVVMFAIVPMFAVLIGGGALALVTPLIRVAVSSTDEAAMRAATALFVASCVYIALMVMVVKTASTLVSGWRLGRDADAKGGEGRSAQNAATAAAQPMLAGGASGSAASAANERARAIVASLPAVANDVGSGSSGSAGGGVRDRRTVVHMPSLDATLPQVRLADRRTPGVGSRFRALPARPRDRLS